MQAFAHSANYNCLRLLALAALFCAACQNVETKGQSKTAGDTARIDHKPVALPANQLQDSGSARDHVARVTNPKTAEMIRNVLTEKIFKEELPFIPAADRNFMFDEIDLNNDRKKEIFVGLRGSYFCGTGGCTAFILNSRGSLISRFTVTEFPIIVRPFRTAGWRDLVIGTAAPRPAMHIVKWNGKKYPGNPAVQPAFRQTPSERSEHVLSCSFHDDHWISF